MTSALMRALGDSKRPLYFLLVASFLNIGLDLLCIITFKMGVFGDGIRHRVQPGSGRSGQPVVHPQAL